MKYCIDKECKDFKTCERALTDAVLKRLRLTVGWINSGYLNCSNKSN